MKEYKLKDRVPCNEGSIIKVIGENYHLEEINEEEITEENINDFFKKIGL